MGTFIQKSSKNARNLVKSSQVHVENIFTGNPSPSWSRRQDWQLSTFNFPPESHTSANFGGDRLTSAAPPPIGAVQPPVLNWDAQTEMITDRQMNTTLSKNMTPPLARHLLSALLACAVFFALAATASAQVRERLLFDSNWRFTRGDSADIGDQLSYAKIKDWVLPAGNPFSTNAPHLMPQTDPATVVSYAENDFDDDAWQRIELPHDWAITGPFDPNLPGDTARLPYSGVGWYRKHFLVSGTDTGKKIYLDLDGAMSYANVWINGQYAGGWPYGYASWRVDLTPFIEFGGQNVLAIRLDNPPESSRWYPGGGIYRNVWLLKTAPIHVGHWGTYVTTPEISPTSATVKIRVNVDNDTGSNAVVSVKHELYELNADGSRGKLVAVTVPRNLAVNPHATQPTEVGVQISAPRLWSLENPQRYVVVTYIHENGDTVDDYETPFGIRTIKFDADQGFFLNGKHVRLNGVCDHSDEGALGTAVNTRALERQVQLLKEMGCNAIRTSHNPPAPELLDLCDRLGMLVMDESFDCWQKGKRPNDYHLIFNDWHEKDWRAELRRDRNHPSIILWSIGNEIPDQPSARGRAIAGELRAIAHQEDPTRPVTAACDHIESAFNGFGTNLDVFGYNYKPWGYARAHAANPTQPIFGSETASCISSRGEYFFPVSTNHLDGKADFQVSSYDLYAPGWATPPDWEFKGQDENPYVAGEFVWTGWDYLGEPTPYGGTNDFARSSYFGIIDLAGFKKDRFYLYQARWRPDFPMAHLVPQRWDWPMGQLMPLHVYTSGDEAELFLNGKSLGRKKKGALEYRIVWNDVRYQPGELKVVAYRNGKPWATDTIATPGPAARLVLKADRIKITADGKDLSFISATIVDRKGLPVSQADNALHFTVTGPGEIVATDNGNPIDLTAFQSPDRNAFNGDCLVIVRAADGTPGKIKVTVDAAGLKSASMRIDARLQ
jgi:beta-galactosidase